MKVTLIDGTEHDFPGHRHDWQDGWLRIFKGDQIKAIYLEKMVARDGVQAEDPQVQAARDLSEKLFGSPLGGRK